MLFSITLRANQPTVADTISSPSLVTKFLFQGNSKIHVAANSKHSGLQLMSL